MSKQASTLQKALPIVAAAYGRKLGVSVAIGNDDNSAYTDGKTIVVPNISSDYPKEVIWGYLAHEASHVRFTDFSVHRQPGVHASLTNIIEDARIEREMVIAYPGVAKELDAIWHYLKQAGYVQDVSDEMPAVGILQMYCLYYLRCRYLKQTMLKDALNKADKAMTQAFAKGARIRLKGLLGQVADITSTREAAALAKAIMDMLEQEANNPSNPDDSDSDSDDSSQDDTTENGSDDAGQSGDSTSADDGDEADDGSDTQGSNDSTSADDGSDTQGSDAAGESGDTPSDDTDTDDTASGNAGGGDGDEDSDADDGSQGDSDDTDADQDSATGDGADDPNGDARQNSSTSRQGDVDADTAKQNARSVLTATADDNIKDPMSALRADMNRDQDFDNPNPVTIPDSSTIAMNGDALLVKQHGDGLGHALKAHVQATSHKLQNRLAGLVEATQRQPVRPARRGKRINTKHLARMSVGDTRIFSAKDSVKKPNAAVHILVDMSGSMFVANADMPSVEARSIDASDIENAMGEADSSEKLGIKMPFQIARNACMALTQALLRIKGVNVGATAFASRHEITPMLRHGETLNHKTLPRFAVRPEGNTALAEALWYSGVELSKTSEERKVMIVLTDGEPNDHWACQGAIRELSKSVEFVGIGILNDAITGLIDNATVVNDLADLEATLMDVARAAILK